MIDAYIALKTDNGPEKINYCFRKNKSHYHMVVQLMLWLKYESSHDVIQQAVTELYARERDRKLSENCPKQ